MISVVIPARDAEAHLARCLAALPDGVDVVVVDDGSTDATAEVAGRAGARVVTGTGEGPAAARNLGAAAARGDLLAFTDADCVPAAGWLLAIARAVEGAGADLVRGPVEPIGPVGRWDRSLWVGRDSPRFESANLAVRRTVFDRVGGFAPLPGGPVAPAHFGEDALFGRRAVRGGARVCWAPEALVRHAVHPRTARGYIAERERLALFGPLVRELPELRASMPARVFLDARTARFDAAVAGFALALVRRRPFWALAAVPYVRSRPEPAQVAADAVGLLALVRGSVRARRLVL